MRDGKAGLLRFARNDEALRQRWRQPSPSRSASRLQASAVRWQNAPDSDPLPAACHQAIECRPNMLPSVSTASAMKPYSPIDIFFFCTRPPAGATRAASTAQSAQLK